MCTIALGCGALAWGVISFPEFWRNSSIEQVADRIKTREPYSTESLVALMPALNVIEDAPYCHPAAMQAASIIRLRVLEATMEGGERRNIDGNMDALRRSIYRSLGCSPADPFLWSVLYWVETTRTGFRDSYINYLRLSYELGPNEGWVAVRRNVLALSVFDRLPDDLREQALDEFAQLVDNGFYEQSVQTLTGPGWRFRDLLLEHLKPVAARHRQAVAKILYKMGYDVSVPGIDRPDPRPWN
jgi:hypothetical protein